MTPDVPNNPPVRHTPKQAGKLIHDLWRERIDVDYRRADTRLRIAGGLGVVVLIGGVIIGDQLGRPEVVGIGVAAGLVTFILALTKASGNYKRARQRFVVEHMADDGTFLFCPGCRAALGDPNDDAVKADPPRECPQCGAGTWRFERPVDIPKHAATGNAV